MKRIKSFEVDHTKLTEGVYVSREDRGVTTFDIRTRRPNIDDVMDNASIHTVEHLFATYVRNSRFAEDIIYFGPMGCRTGFYFLTVNISLEDALNLIKEAFRFIASYEGEIPGVSEKECGNYKEHSLPGAKAEAERFLPLAEEWNASNM
ncbi:MAG: S-ribosylhomocysteine lyase [Oscillospiraceae bacterium]|nr:S-ribosylhomocysteine lyase [Oscillospiraceae bacterium]